MHSTQFAFNHHSYSTAGLDSAPELGTTPSSLFNSTHPPSIGSGSQSSSSPEQDHSPFSLEHTPAPVIPGLSLPKGQLAKPKRGRPPSSARSASPTEHDVVVKRQRNNVAAKKYRQKKIDRIQELEEEVDDVKKERDELRIRLARQEAETKALREMLKLKIGGDSAAVE